MNAEDIRLALKEVKDPEIPTISLVDLGIVTGIEVDGRRAHITLTPTFAGCPALRLMEDLVRNRLLKEEALDEVEVETRFDITWNTDMITEEGRKAIQQHGLAPPKPKCREISMEALADTACPYCGSKDTDLKSPFGPTLCRSLHYCNNCRQAFEGFKPV